MEKEIKTEAKANIKENKEKKFVEKYMQMPRKKRREICKQYRINWQDMPRVSRQVNNDFRPQMYKQQRIQEEELSLSGCKRRTRRRVRKIFK